MYWNYLCPKCQKIQNLMKVYTPEQVRGFIDKCLTVPNDKLEKRQEIAPEILKKV
ncbi:unnamed protein product [marine sediment metagenome]|uniref:Uncharacterized protein n=1 Tax=marine sediment metagenome TaxID=412755 RepID=X0T4X1_9ZZZZ